MTIQDIITVLTIVQEKSFSKAAERLYVSQSAISQSVAKLERELGTTLFIRTTKAVSPTESCLFFVEKGGPVVEMYHQFCTDVKQMAQPNEQHLRIGVTSFFSRYLGFQKEVRNNRETYPFDVELVEDTSLAIEQMVLNGKLDFAFVRAPLSSAALQWEPLFTERLLLMVPATHPICQEIPISEALPHPVVDLNYFKTSPFVMINNARITSNCIKMCQEAGFMPQIVASTPTWERIYNHVVELELVGFISTIFAKPYANDLPVRYFQIDSDHAALDHVVIYHAKNRLSRNARMYINAAREHLLLQHTP